MHSRRALAPRPSIRLACAQYSDICVRVSGASRACASAKDLARWSCATTCFMPRPGMGACGLRQAPPATHAMRRRSEGGNGGIGGGAGGAKAVAESAKMIMLADASEASSSDASEAQSGESGRAKEASETCGVKRTAVNCDKLKQLEFSGAGVREALCSCSPYSRTLQRARPAGILTRIRGCSAAPKREGARVELAYNLRSTTSGGASLSTDSFAESSFPSPVARPLLA